MADPTPTPPPVPTEDPQVTLDALASLGAKVEGITLLLRHIYGEPLVEQFILKQEGNT